MPTRYAEQVVQALSRHLGVAVSEIAQTHDLFRDWGFTPLSLVVVLLDLERSVALELPSQELSSVRTVADLVSKFRSWVQESDASSAVTAAPRARRSKSALGERRLRRELHRLRWLEQNAQRRALHAARGPNDGAARRVASR